MQTQEEMPVLVDELVGRLGGSYEAVSYWLERERVKVSSDWSGRETVRASDAKRIVEAYKAAMAEHAQLLSEFDNYVKARQRRLIEASDAAYRETAERELKRQYEMKPGPSFAEGGVTFTHPLSLWPGGRAASRTAGLEAYQAFEQREPLLDFTEWQKKRRK